MGCGASQPAPPQGASRESEVSAAIDRDLDRARRQEEEKVKLLLLGAGESGKSTIFKQMRILYGTPRSEDDLRMYGVVVRANIVTAIRQLCRHLRNLGLEDALDKESEGMMNGEEGPPAASPKTSYDQIMAHIVELTASQPAPELSNGDTKEEDWVGQSPRAGLNANNDAKLFLQHYNAIRTLWQSNTMKHVWSKRSAVNVIDGHKDYMKDIDRIAARSYRPTTQDILLARVKTTHVVVERYLIEGIQFEMYDVGGQRAERRNWVDCFDKVDAVIFVAALSEYDQSLAEAKRANRMVEALDLFRSVCNNRAFADTSIMLFLNKKDIFAEKILESDIAAQRPFADYSGPPKNFDQGVLYFIQKFKECLIDDEFNDAFIHVTCATDTNNMEFVLDSTRTIIMTGNLKRAGFFVD
eukprot:CAMPEP_0118687920 /NCGR_PEP_ID=MMETSP0800-20121206/8643_1 /TAXON_ID=210618 ORGANISM="Striatella unipunctata, Strain CCMP2910" /NCGR_SAMPLE_ID=MMETSP0800 /ASSEMBLY_ACC=CAM_ASM_000638 /LENGTH=411 /DNA_ID=CAMNT_0006585143 /DNA_START=166 /DNA_END=1401 /DNA_ORIENTATION=+